MMKHVLVLGASLKEYRYSNIAVKTLIKNHYPVTAIGNRSGHIAGTEVLREIPANLKPVDTVTLYLGPPNQKAYYEKILSLKPNRLIFNPGTENEELKKLANQQGIKTLEACTINMVSHGFF
ncbi:MAG: CoA-binding protein [Bacteroidales bacterium]|nr:CoA-binding protein [Bacteroidales bacterium]MCF8328155.1 CoA-binding protein [Bacteroidales bacterium]